MLDISAAARSELGRREANEDKVRVLQAGPWWLALLADGAGGHRGGAEASLRTIEGLEQALCETTAEFSAPFLSRAVLHAHANVQEAQHGAKGSSRMHSTVVALWIDAGRATALWSHVGDSRLYRARGGTLELLTADDSVVQRLVDARLLTPQQAEAHPQKNQLIAALGIEDAIEPHTSPHPVELQEGDAFLLCSDGWWGELDDSAIRGCLAEAADPVEWLSAMQRRIEAAGAERQDNFSAIGVWVGGPARPRGNAEAGF